MIVRIAIKLSIDDDSDSRASHCFRSVLVKLEEVGIQIESGNRSRVCELYWDLSYSLRFHTIGLFEECEWCGVAPGVALPQRGASCRWGLQAS